MRSVILLGVLGIFAGSTALAARGNERRNDRALPKAGGMLERLATRLPGMMKFTRPLRRIAKDNPQLTSERFHIPGGVPLTYDGASKRAMVFKGLKWLTALLMIAVGVNHGVTEMGIPLTDVATLAKTAIKEAHPGWSLYAIPTVVAAVCERINKRPVQLELIGRALNAGVKLEKPLLKTYRRIARKRARGGTGYGYWACEAEKADAAIKAGGVLPADWAQ